MGQKVTQNEVEEWVALHKKGYTYRHIGEKYGRHPKTVGKNIREYLKNHPTEREEGVGGKLSGEVNPLTVVREKDVPPRPITLAVTEKDLQLPGLIVKLGALTVKTRYEKKSTPELLKLYEKLEWAYAFCAVSVRDDLERAAVQITLLERGQGEAVKRIEDKVKKLFNEYDLARARGEVG